MDYLDKKFPSAGTRLYPDDPAARFKVLAARAPSSTPIDMQCCAQRPVPSVDRGTVRAQVQLFADTFTEQLSYMGLLRADSAEAFETAKQKFITGLTVSMRR